jgi:hypothetical protein
MKCEKCRSENTRLIRELFDPQRTARYCDDCRHLWKPAAPMFVSLPPVRVRGFDRFFARLGEILGGEKQ